MNDQKDICPVCRGAGSGIDPVFGNRGKCYPCDGTGKDHRVKPDHAANCWICANWRAFGGKPTYV